MADREIKIILTMRYVLLLLILAITGCSGQETTKEHSRIDTAKLYDPNPQSDEIGGSEATIFRRNIVLTKPDYYVIINEQEHKLETIDKVKDFIKSHKEQIQENKFYIVRDSSTAFNKIVSIINILTENQIKNYKVINLQEYLAPPEPVTIQAPHSIVTTYDENDSTYFSIEILNKGINVRLQGQETKLKTTTELDSFVTAHKSDIKEIAIITTKDIPSAKFNEVIEVLKKHEYTKFNLVSK